MRRASVLYAALACLVLFPAPGSGRQAGDSPHGRLRADIDCSACHTSGGWAPARHPMDFNHNTGTRFVLEGRHAVTSCNSCHIRLRFTEPQLANGDCGSCHLDVHRGRLGATCTLCHNTTTFTEVQGIALHAQTSFPLVGAHLQVPCESCHTDDRGGAFSTLDVNCESCHPAELAVMASIDHQDAGFVADCDRCHVSLTWTGGVAFDHITASGGFALVGVHDAMRCGNCHRQPGNTLIHPASTPNDCIACHEAAFQEEHSGMGFPTECTMCHSAATQWSALLPFDHAAAARGFVLLGAHANLPCGTCHNPTGNTLNSLAADQNDCITCHESAFQREHGGSGYPTTCLACHTAENWDADGGDHDAAFFPIFAGPHKGKWDNCATCHVVPENFRIFNCLNCHEHRRSAMDAEHREERGYTYESSACLSCHPNGRGELP